MSALSLITSLGKEGKSPLEIARELHVRGVKDERGRVIAPAVVEGFMRFAELSPGVDMTGAVWGKSDRTKVSPVEHDDAAQAKKRKNRWQPGNNLPDDLKAQITHLYQHEHLRSNEIAERLGVALRKVAPFCAVLSGFTMPPGEIEEVVDAEGRRILKCPPGYARGAYPQRNVGAKGGT